MVPGRFRAEPVAGRGARDLTIPDAGGRAGMGSARSLPTSRCRLVGHPVLNPARIHIPGPSLLAPVGQRSRDGNSSA
jgi:hypothetical protein